MNTTTETPATSAEPTPNTAPAESEEARSWRDFDCALSNVSMINTDEISDAVDSLTEAASILEDLEFDSGEIDALTDKLNEAMETVSGVANEINDLLTRERSSWPKIGDELEADDADADSED